MVKTKYFYSILFLVLGLVLFSEITNSDSRKLKLSGIDYSDELKSENYEPLESLLNYYDGIYTFFHDTIDASPIEMSVDLRTGGNEITVSSYYEHTKVLRLYDNTASDYCEAKYYFNLSIEYKTNIEFFVASNGITRVSYYQFYNQSNEIMFEFRIEGSSLIFYYFDDSGTYRWVDKNGGNINNEQWYHCRIEYILESGLNIWFDNVLEHSNLCHSRYLTEKVKYMRIVSSIGGSGYLTLMDALNFYSPSCNLKTEILNVILKPTNFFELDNNKLFSFYSSIIDKYPTNNNNYREYYIIDKVINDNYIDKSRLLRKKGLEISQNKYKVIQFYFDDLNNSNAFRNDYNQSIEVRIDSMDSNENLINKYFINLEFNKTDGLLTWKALYRESLAIPIWSETLTNPIFKFSDYLPENTELTSLQVNLHVFLSYINTTQKYLFIRTDVCVNDYYSMSYQYDKIIDAGNSVFYYTQSKLQVRYIDYFNNNSAIDYLGNSWYTMNNLRGLRTLMLNSTDYKFNFLDAGYFKTELDYYIPPVIPEPDPQPDPPDEPDPPDDDMDYWKYESFNLKKSGYNTISFSQNVAFYNETVLVEYSLQFDLLVGNQYTAKYYYNDELFSKSSLGNWELTLNIGLGDFIISFNWIRDITRTILNAIILFFQFLLYLLVVAFNYLIMFLIMVIIVPFFWNFPIYWVVFLAIMIMFFVYVLFVWLIGIIWSFLIWIYEFILLPLFTFLIHDFLPLMLEIIVIVIAWLLALIIWLSTFCQADFDLIYSQTSDLTQTIVDFLVETIITFTDNIGSLLLYLIWFVMLIMFCYLKIIYCKAKGFVSRTEQLQESLNAYIFPFEKVKKLIITIKESVFRWS